MAGYSRYVDCRFEECGVVASGLIWLVPGRLKSLFPPTWSELKLAFSFSFAETIADADNTTQHSKT